MAGKNQEQSSEAVKAGTRDGYKRPSRRVSVTGVRVVKASTKDGYHRPSRRLLKMGIIG